MTTSNAARALAVTLLLTFTADALADEAPPAAVAPAPAAAEPGRNADADRMHRARFSGKRLLVEIVAGALVGSVVSYLTFEATCSDGDDCFGAAFLAFGANVAVTPIAVWGVGNLMDGQGSLGWTYLGASVALAPFSATGPVDETPAEALQRIKIELIVATIALPITSALLYELSSGLKFVRWRQRETAVGVTPIAGSGGIDGVMGAFSTRF